MSFVHSPPPSPGETQMSSRLRDITLAVQKNREVLQKLVEKHNQLAEAMKLIVERFDAERR